MVDFISWFSNSKLFSRNLVTGTQLFGRDNFCFPMLCYTVPHCRPAQYLFSLSSIFFNTSSAVDLSTSLFTSSSLDQYLSSKKIFSPLEIPTQPQLGWQTQAGWVFSPMIWCLGRFAHFKRANSSSKEIHVIEWSLCVCTCSPRLLYQDQILLSFPAERRSSNSSFNIPRYDANEPIPTPSPPNMIFAICIQTSNTQEPPQVSSLLLNPPFFFT